MKNTSMIHRFNTISDEISSLYHKASEKMGMADSELVILYMICDYEETISQSDIVNITGLSKQTVNSAVSRMEKEGLILRRSQTENKKNLNLKLTSAGEEVIRNHIEPFREQEEHIFSDWTDEEKEIFLRLNEKYRDALREIVKELPRSGTADQKRNR